MDSSSNISFKQEPSFLPVIKKSSKKKLSVPQLNTELVINLQENKKVPLNFCPQSVYKSPRSIITDKQICEYFNNVEGNCVFNGCQFSLSSAMVFCEHIKNPRCKLKNVSFVNCGFTKEIFSEICRGLSGNTTVNTLQFEGLSFQPTLCSSLLNVLKSPATSLKTLNFVNVDLPADALAKVVEGIISQNELSNGISTFCIEGCKLSDAHAESLECLITQSKKLKSLLLQGNQLGSGISIGFAKQSSKAIKAIVSGLKNNDSILVELVLSSNQISLEEYNDLVYVIKNDNKTVTVNLTENCLDVKNKNKRIITKGSSPRSMASPRQKSTPRSDADEKVNTTGQKILNKT